MFVLVTFIAVNCIKSSIF